MLVLTQQLVFPPPCQNFLEREHIFYYKAIVSVRYTVCLSVDSSAGTCSYVRVHTNRTVVYLTWVN